MTALVACDLDQTLVYSARSAGAAVDRAVCVETYQGRPQSFVTPAAVAAIEALAGSGLLVPTTTRTREQLARIVLPGPPPRYAIAANGGRLLVDGVADEAWSRRVGRSVALGEVTRRAGRYGGAVRTAEDLFVYAVVDPATVPDDVDAREREWCEARGWVFSRQGRKLYWIPATVSKAAAAREVAERMNADVLLAAGDSLLDRDLLDLADRGWLARHGELAASGYANPRVTVTAGTGLAAGEEIARALAAAAAVRAPVPSVTGA